MSDSHTLEKHSPMGFDWALLLMALTLAGALVKAVLTLWVPGPSVFGDELIYKQNALAIFQGNAYPDAHYPYLYPLFLAPAFFFGERFFTIMKFLNILPSSATALVGYALARLYMPPRTSFFAGLSILLMPFLFIMPQYLMSENLFYPLFLGALYFLVKPVETGKHRKWAFSLGLLCGAMVACRYMGQILVAAMAGLWLLRFFVFDRNALSTRAVLESMGLISAGFALLYLPWVFICLFSDISIQKMLGLMITGGVQKLSYLPEGRTLWPFIALYAAYVPLMLGPALGMFLYALGKGAAGRFRTREGWFALFVFVLGAVMILLASRHSFRAFYNAEHISRILGRYISYFAAPALIASFACLPKTMKKGWWVTALCALFGVFLVGCVYMVKLTLFDVRFFTPISELFNSRALNAEGIVLRDFRLFSPFWIWAGLLGLVMLAFRFAPKHSAAVLALAMLLFHGMGLVSAERSTRTFVVNPLHTSLARPLHARLSQSPAPIVLFNASGFKSDHLKTDLLFFDNRGQMNSAQVLDPSPENLDAANFALLRGEDAELPGGEAAVLPAANVRVRLYDLSLPGVREKVAAHLYP